MNPINIRENILDLLIRIEKQDAYLNILIPSYLNRHTFKSEDKALIQEISYGVTRYRKKLDWIIDQFLDYKNKKLSITVRNILRMGVYQIINLNKIPDYAICNESVELVKKSKDFRKSKLVNAVLRNTIRRLDNIFWPDINRESIKYISIFYSYPEWLVRKWIKRFGLELCIRICQASNNRPEITLRLNPLKISIQDLKKNLKGAGMEFKESQYLPDEALVVRSFSEIGSSYFFINGLFSIQDESSILVSKLLDPLPGELVIDMCSGPGGKTTHLAQIMGNKGEIIAFEKNKKRLGMIAEECIRLGVGIVKPILHDSSQLSKDYLKKADKILVDVPCSGTGVIKKKPDMKWRKINSEWLKRINQSQEVILDIASQYLRQGGEMVYSTCSIEREENDILVNKFLKNNKGFVLKETSAFVKTHNLTKYETEIKQAIQLIPGYSGGTIDGFYMVKIKKIK